MNDPIKIVYNWIGPRGPLINTEIPNLLSLASAGDGTSTNSTRFWADDVFHRLFMHNGNYPLSSSFMTSHNDTFIYPFTLSWRVPFNYYLYGGSGILEFSHTPQHIIHQVRVNKGFFLIDLSAEAYVKHEHLNALHSYFSHFHKIPMGKIIYLTGCANANQLYALWCERNGIPNDPMQRMVLISFPTSQYGIASNMKSTVAPPLYNDARVPDKLFLMWNRRYRPHRIALCLGLNQANLIDRSYVSLGLTDPEMPTAFFPEVAKHAYGYNLEIPHEEIDKLASKLPLVLDGETDIMKMCGDFDSATRHYYENSLVSIVTETNFEAPEISMTEKSFKPVKEKHPFIIVGSTGSLQAMRQFGFKTFSDFWDESYDNILDSTIRMRKILDLCIEIGTWSPEKILEFRRNVKPIVDHNFEVVKKNVTIEITQNITTAIRDRTK